MSSMSLVMKLEGLNYVLVRPIMLTPFGGWWLGGGFWMMFEFGGEFVDVELINTLPSSIRSYLSCFK